MKLAGLNIPFTYRIIGVPNIDASQVCQQSETMGFMIRAVAKNMKLEMGLMGEVFETPIIFKCLMTDMCLKWLWLNYAMYSLSIQTDVLLLAGTILRY